VDYPWAALSAALLADDTLSSSLGATAAWPAVATQLTSSTQRNEDLYDTMKDGPNVYLIKEISIEEVANGICSVAQVQSLISPSWPSSESSSPPWPTGRRIAAGADE
jgi:DNA-binding NarL/FixJ family response regulator